MQRSLPIFLSFIMLSPFTFAQQPDEEDENFLDEIVVTATRIATPLADTLPSTQIITTEEIERLQPQDLGDLLSRKSGLTFRDSGGRGSSGGIFVRGTEDSQVLILIDGVRTASATSGQTAIERIPLESIEKIEIVKGPMSGVYGADAVGGVIHIFTKQYQQIGSFATVKATAGSNQFRQYHARTGYGNEDFSVSASLSKESTDGIDRTEYKGGGNEDRDGFNQSSGSFSLSTQLQDDLIVRMNHIQSSSRSEYDNTSTSGSNSRENKGNDWHQLLDLKTSSIRVDYDHSEKLQVSGLLGSTTDLRKDIKLDHSSSPRTHFETKKSDYSVQANLNLSTQNRLTFGIDYQKDKVDSTDSYSVTERTNKGFFALWQRLGEISSTAANARYDKNDAYGQDSNYSLRQSFNLSDEYEFVASYGTAFNAPTFNSLYFSDGFFFGNPNLKPEESRTFEMSLRAHYNDLFWQINSYQTKAKNMIDWIYDSDTFRYNAVNIDKATLKGIEVELTKKWENYIFNTSIDYLDAKNDKSGEFLDDRARVSASLEIGKQINNLYVGVDAYLEHARFDKGSQLPGYAIWGVTGRYDFSDTLSMTGYIDNLFDKTYFTNVATSRISRPDPYYQNEGRTINVSLEYKF